MGSNPQSLSELLKLEDDSVFWRGIFQKKVLHVPGKSDRFSHLFTWENLAEIIQSHRIDFPRIRLIQDGSVVPKGEFLSYIHARNGEIIPRIKKEQFRRIIESGSVMVLNSVDEMITPIRELVTQIGDDIGEYLLANLYYGLANSKGFSLHTDDQDVFILQIYGEKRWEVYCPGSGRNADAFVEKQKDLSLGWQGILTQGSVLYVPKYWSHSAQAESESLHITISLSVRTEIDYVSWLLGQQDVQSALSEILALPKEGDFDRMARILRAAMNPDSLARFRSQHLRIIKRGKGLHFPITAS